jgi:hypothetical protein
VKPSKQVATTCLSCDCEHALFKVSHFHFTRLNLSFSPLVNDLEALVGQDV